MGQKEMNCWH